MGHDVKERSIVPHHVHFSAVPFQLKVIKQPFHHLRSRQENLIQWKSAAGTTF